MIFLLMFSVLVLMVKEQLKCFGEREKEKRCKQNAQLPMKCIPSIETLEE